MLSPYLGMLIIDAHFNFALAVLGIAAVTDLVISSFLLSTTSPSFIITKISKISCFSWMVG